jgi:CheY-like chemotaxis protein
MTRSAALKTQGGGARAGAADTLPGTAKPSPQTIRARSAARESAPAAGSEGAGERRGTGPVSLETVLAELRAVRAVQEDILAILRGEAGSASGADVEAEEGDSHAVSVVRSARRKSVLLIDDDADTREAAVGELQQADVPVRAVAEGNTALRAIAEEKPDVIAIELGLRGDMAGKDIINMIKATMEWVDIPIVLWTREAVDGQKEARLIHGADELVPKSGGAAALAARVITLFRRG